MAASTEDLLKIKVDLMYIFENLMKSFEVTSDGICITDVEYNMMELNSKLFQLQVVLHGR